MVRKIVLISSVLFDLIFPISDSTSGGIAAQLEQAEEIYGHILTDYPAIDHAFYAQRNLFSVYAEMFRQVDSTTQEKDL